MAEAFMNIRKQISAKPWIFGLLWLILPIIFFSMDYFMHVLIMIAIYVMLAQSLNLVMGCGGQSQLGHAAFFGIGAYFTGLLIAKAGWDFWVTLPIAFVGTAIIGLLIGLPSIRVSGDYLGIVTLGFGEITRLVLTNWDSLTNGPMGVPGIPTPSLFGFSLDSKISFFYLVTFFAGATWFIMNRLINSKFGFQLLAIRTDERGAEVLGVNIGLIKVTAFALSAAFAGVAGSIYSSYFSFISPDSFLFTDSLAVLCMVVVGGMGNMAGVVIGAVILTIAPEMFRFLGDYRMLLYGALLTVMVIFRPMGIWGLDKRKRNIIKYSCEKVNV